jgi:isopentenyl phosphate kinase
MNTLSEDERRDSLVFVKLGGSLLTDKTRPETVRSGVLDRLAEELVDGTKGELRGRLVLGHGSGSYGHAAAKQHGFDRRGDSKIGPAAVSAVQDAAARLHRQVVSVLMASGASPFSIVAGSALLARKGQPEAIDGDLLAGILRAGCLPVVYGDVVIDRDETASILSTETLFMVLIRRLLEAGRRIDEVVWLGETEGILDSSGQLVREIGLENGSELMKSVGGAAGIDVTGGMRHRLETALCLAGMGVPSRIADGRVPGLLRAALSGEVVAGTVILPVSES